MRPVKLGQEDLDGGLEYLPLLLNSFLHLGVGEAEGQHLGALGDEHVKGPTGGVTIYWPSDLSVKVVFNLSEGLPVAVFIFPPEVVQLLLLTWQSALIFIWRDGGCVDHRGTISTSG